MKISEITSKLRRLAQLPAMRRAIAFDSARLFLEESLRYRQKGVSERAEGEMEAIVSLTSYGPRLRTAYLTVASLMRQSRRAHRLILWLAQEERDNIPASLRLLEPRGLEIRFCADLRSYKKIIPALTEFPDATIITADDDCLYDFDFIDRLLMAAKAAPGHIICNRMRQIKLSGGKIAPYREWEVTGSTTPSPLNVAIGCGGILYPPRALPSETLDADLFMSLAPDADDLWLKAMALKQGTPVIRAVTPHPLGDDVIPIPGIDYHGALTDRNVADGGNDRAVAALAQYFDPLAR
ncbi:MAG: hypothetical protein NC342_08035 [Pseudoflavonifractor sp.]|nr:hypothetical protein [Alloprevotella sp.]MCM1117470.1 hypothetical protein [Pseudoflavonifractor sp.]